VMVFQKSKRKEQLYTFINKKLEELGISHSDYPLDSIKIAESHKNLSVEFLNFQTTNIGGVIYKGDVISAIGLNPLRSKKGQNFDCMHELIHYWLHPMDSIICYDENFISQDKEIEWQANEGAAQALMPEKLFLEKYKLYSGDIEALSDFFFVGEQAVKFRIENLGLQKVERINLSEKPVILRETSTVKKLHCKVCGNAEISAAENYCKICGNDCFCFSLGYYWLSYQHGPSGKNYCASNECTLPLPSNARYCTCCGSKSTFYVHNLLKAWEHEDLEQRLANFRSFF
jgi:Zn-dependent peptidase ImmA (M78 family)